jgi:hypothetical protein
MNRPDPVNPNPFLEINLFEISDHLRIVNGINENDIEGLKRRVREVAHRMEFNDEEATKKMINYSRDYLEENGLEYEIDDFMTFCNKILLKMTTLKQWENEIEVRRNLDQPYPDFDDWLAQRNERQDLIQIQGAEKIKKRKKFKKRKKSKKGKRSKKKRSKKGKKSKKKRSKKKKI